MTSLQSNFLKDLLHRKGFEESELYSIVYYEVGLRPEEALEDLENWELDKIFRWLRRNSKKI